MVSDFFRRGQEDALPWIVNATLPFYAVQSDHRQGTK